MHASKDKEDDEYRAPLSLLQVISSASPEKDFCHIYISCDVTRTPDFGGTTYEYVETCNSDSNCPGNQICVQSVCVGTYKLGGKGEDACPTGYNTITNAIECEAAAQAFAYNWDADLGSKDENSLCNYNTGASPYGVRLSSNHGSGAYWICLKDYSTGKLTKCQRDRENHLGACAGSKGCSKGSYVVTCNEDGSYAEVQCNGSTGYCWCVDENGSQVGDSVQGLPNCGVPVCQDELPDGILSPCPAHSCEDISRFFEGVCENNWSEILPMCFEPTTKTGLIKEDCKVSCNTCG